MTSSRLRPRWCSVAKSKTVLLAAQQTRCIATARYSSTPSRSEGRFERRRHRRIWRQSDRELRRHASRRCTAGSICSLSSGCFVIGGASCADQCDPFSGQIEALAEKELTRGLIIPRNYQKLSTLSPYFIPYILKERKVSKKALLVGSYIKSFIIYDIYLHII